jgi:hypothetical protein
MDDDELLMEESDAYLRSQLDYMYSESNDDMFRQSIKERIKEFYGDDDQPDIVIAELPEDIENEIDLATPNKNVAAR